jgi:lactoylglutathione lyase
VQQIALGATDKQRLARLWVDLLGLEPAGNYRSLDENVDEDILRIGAGTFAVEVDLMQPIDPHRSPRVAEPALNHVGLWVDDLPSAVAWLTARGVRFAPGGIRRGAGGHDVCFIHPKGSADAPQGGEGVLIELVQAPADVIASHGAPRGS